MTSQFGECKEQEIEESEENKSSVRGNNLSALKMDTDPFFPGDIAEDNERSATFLRPTDSPFEKTRSLFGTKENFPSN